MNTWMDTREKVFAYIREHHMLQAGDRVVAGVSGGADSVCLLFLLLEWQKEVPTDIAVVHVDHGIRAEAGEDARYVEQLCEERGIPFFLTRAEVRNRARMEKISEEEAGRRTRYEAFEKAAKEWGATKIAVAHNSNDRSETQLFHLFRGSGIRGLASILPVRDRIIRPLLCLERWEIEKFLQQRGIVYCKDATNEEDDYTRNRIRHHILPYAEENIVKGCVAHMNQTAELLAAAVTDFGAYYLLEPPAVGSPEWLEKWDAKLAAVLHTPDEEGFSRQVLCGEEDYGSTDVLAYVSERRREKARLAFLRLLYPWKLAEPQKCELAAYLTAHTKGGESEEAWQVILRERGNDRVYYSLFAELGCLNAENLCPVLEDIGEEFPEMKAYFLQRMAQAPAATNFFAGLEL